MIKQGDTILNKRTGQQMTFLQTWRETKGTLLQIDCVSPPTSAREPLHIHPFQLNRFRVVSGELRFLINGKERTALPGETVSIPKNTPHCFWNPGETDARYLQEFFPALRTDNLFETFFALARDGRLNKHGAPNILRTSLIMLAHEKELRLVRPSWTIQRIVFSALAPLARLLGYQSQYK